MWGLIMNKLYYTDTSVKTTSNNKNISNDDVFFNQCIKKLQKNNDNTKYEFIEKMYINDGSDLDKCLLILVKYKTHIPLNQIIGLCVSAKDSLGNNLSLFQQKHNEINVLYNVFDKFNTKVFDQGILMTHDHNSFQEVDAVMYNILLVSDNGDVCKLFV